MTETSIEWTTGEDGTPGKTRAETDLMSDLNGHEARGPRWLVLRDRKGGDPSEWPEDLRIREFPEGR